MSSSIRASSTKTKPSRHVRFGEDGEIEIAGHGGLRASDIPAENISEEEYDGDEELADGDEEEYSDENGEEEYSDGEDLGEDMAIEEAIEHLGVIGQALVTEDGLGVVDVLEDIATSLKQIVKILYASHRGNRG